MVCIDEPPVQLIKETRPPLPAAPRQAEKVDYEYARHGTANSFMCTEPRTGTRPVRVTAHRSAVDWACAIRDLLEVRDPAAMRVRLVCAHLNTPSIGSLYEAFPPEPAHRLAARLEMHHTPKHGSWLNIAEIELRALTLQGLDRRMPDMATLSEETQQWEERRKASQKGVDWQFSPHDARIKLKRLYPQIQD